MKKQIDQINGKNVLLLVFAGMVNAFGITLFLSQTGLYDSGISGTSMLFSYLLPFQGSLSLFLLLLNIPLFLFGAKRQGWLFTLRALIAVASYSVFAFLLNRLLFSGILKAPVKEDIFLSAAFGGLISGLGSGLAIRFGGAMDGIEVMAVIFAKSMGITVGSFCMAYNALLYIAAGFITGNWILPLYSIVAYAAGQMTIDYIVEGFDRAKGAMIVTELPEEICRNLMDTFGTGATILSAKGGFSGRSKSVVYFVVNRFQVPKMRRLVHETDSAAYITISEVADVFVSNQQKDEKAPSDANT